MKKILSILVATALTGTTVLPALADKPSIVNGMPCVAEVCVGDYLKNLGNINWISVDSKIAPYKRLPIKKGLMVGTDAAIKTFEPYLDTYSMDKKGIAAASHVKLCNISHLHGLEGTYFSKSGKKVAVEFDLVPLNDGKSQEFFVSKITTTLPNTRILTEDQAKEIDRDVIKKYGSIHPLQILEPGTGVTTNYSTSGSKDAEIVLQFTPGYSFPDITRLLHKYPGCASPKVNIN
jgi:hypothetical protein